MSETAMPQEATGAHPMRILEKYKLHCPDCSNGRTKIIRWGRDYRDVMPCPTCRPADNRDFMRKRDSQPAKKK